MLKSQPLPQPMQEASIISDLCLFSVDDLDTMPVYLIELIILYRNIKLVIEYGGELKL